MKQSIKQFFKKLNETTVSKKYIIIVLGISMLMVCSYFSYAMFTVSKEKQNAIKIVTGNLTYKLTVNGTTATSISVPAKTTSEYTIVLTNPNSRKARFNFYYMNTNALQEGVSIGYKETSDTSELPTATGVTLDKDASNTYVIKITNLNSTAKTVNLGVEVGLDYNDLSLPASSSGNTPTIFTAYVPLGSPMKVTNFGTDYSAAVRVVTKNDNTVPSGATSVQDLSVDGDNSVVAYLDSSNTLTIGGTNGIILQEGGASFTYMANVTSIDLEYFDTSNVTDMNSMFFGCSSLTSLNLTSFDTSNVTSMGFMFPGCSSLTSLDLSNFDTSNVTGMGSMFWGCSSLTSLNLTSFDTSKVTGMHDMFYNCSSLTSLDLSNFDTSSVIYMGDMFFGCSSLTSLNLTSFDTSKVTNMSNMFFDCSSLTSLDLSNFDTSKVTNMNDMFSYCSQMQSIKVSSKWVVNSGCTTTDMFNECGVSSVTVV